MRVHSKKNDMNRRDFLKRSMYTALMSGGAASLGLGTPRVASAQAAIAYGRTLVNVMLLGGADLRFLLVPEPGTPYADKFWDARKSIYQYNPANTALYPDYLAVWNALYTPATDGVTTFGIHNNAAWLKAQFDLGNVAIVANTLGSDNRRHDHSQLIVNTGDPLASQYVYDRDGWGGRLVYATGAANAVAVTNDISIFCNGTDAANRNARVVHVKDTRDFGLSPGDGDPLSDDSAMARALRSYYAQKQIEAASMPDSWPYRKFLQHEQAVRAFGDAFNARLSAVAPVQPVALQNLYTSGSGNTLNSAGFGRQCANVYDSFLGADLFQMRVLSMEYTGWDTHRAEKADFEANIEDLFGAGKGLDTLTQELELLPGVADSVAYTFNTDFGRQLRANGDYGTDHGRGNYLITVGRSVAGGVYGEMFPASEIEGGAGSTRFDQQGADIEGRTSIERVLSAACDWVEPGTGAQVFPDAATSALESGLNLDDLFGSLTPVPEPSVGLLLPAGAAFLAGLTWLRGKPLASVIEDQG
jgi:uncharacterized protein (DUF1501 family)